MKIIKMDIYNIAIGLEASLDKITREFPRNTYYLVNLINGAARKISTNLAEAHSRLNETERKEFFWSAKDSVQDCSQLIDIAVRQGYLAPEIRNDYRGTLDDLSSGIQNLIRTSPQISEN